MSRVGFRDAVWKMKSGLNQSLAWHLIVGCTGSPPAPDQPPQVRRILEDDRYDWVALETENTRVYYPAGSYAETQRSALPGRAEDARATVLRRLSGVEYRDLLHLFYVDSREDMVNLTGNPVTGFSYFSDHAVVIVFNEGWRAFERHELAHAITLDSWGTPAGPSVVEGLATQVDGECGGYENGRMARTALDQGAMIPLEALTEDFRTQDDLIAYLQAASIIEFMVHRMGPEAVSRLWDQGLQVSPALLGTSAVSFRAEFENWLAASYDPVPATAWEAVRSGGCGIDARRGGQ